jgi:carboxypeptidase T
VARYHITVRAGTYAALAPLVREHGINPMRTEPAGDGGYVIDSYADDEQIAALEAAGYQVERLEDIDAGRDERMAEVSDEDAYKDRPPMEGKPEGEG